MQLAFLIDAHQNASQKPIGSVPAYTLPPQPIDVLKVWFRDFYGPLNFKGRAYGQGWLL